jgi:hypothetical protein
VVLYIDDLDRCPPSVVAKVLDAVHLLLALPLFTVIVGVDPRWLERSLTQTHRDLFGQDSSPAAPSDYLEKIFQLTYNLPPLTRDSTEELLAGAWGDILQKQTSSTNGAGPSGPYTTPAGTEQAKDESIVTTEPGGAEGVRAVDRTVEALTLRNEEVDAVGEVASLVASTPRRAKRFLSTYLVARARAYAQIEDQVHFDTTASQGLLVLVALMVGTPSAVPLLSEETFSQDDPTLVDWVWRLNSPTVQLDSADRARLEEFAMHSASLGALRLSEVISWRDAALPFTTLSNHAAPPLRK